MGGLENTAEKRSWTEAIMGLGRIEFRETKFRTCIETNSQLTMGNDDAQKHENMK